ncbi:hypothetical protein Pcinc_018062 [Petrolisthes cinctipes]|uniref:Uncharacterized protein n=1 Tax=Petrolisthes cinctipes TaxID=88211 RepID=A0AAE1FNW7_PETCI|nr:hypothetical protein Pcinc_018062 [Petrolisthes cinctipes]
MKETEEEEEEEEKNKETEEKGPSDNKQNGDKDAIFRQSGDISHVAALTFLPSAGGGVGEVLGGVGK